MNYEILVSDYRNGILENIHPGHICGVDEFGSVKYQVGNPDHLTFLRSALKPIQAIPAIANGIQEHFKLTNRETALIAASHRGEEFHVDELEKLLDKVGIQEEELLCHPTYPLNPRSKDKLAKNNQPNRRLYHNCSGKHLGMIALAKILGVSTEGYFKPDHPVQQEILSALSSVSGCKVEHIHSGVDGCGVPVYALPLRYIANTYLRFARPELIEDRFIRRAVFQITSMMNENPDIISGTDTICTSLLMDGNIVAKGGAQGVYCFGLDEEKMGFSLKVIDGSEEQWPIIVASILEQINYKNKDTIQRLYQLTEKDIYNDNNKLVGNKEASFKLNGITSGTL
ncbi:asparaginase [Virgibacillus necropolis]|uniref:Asparaginase n=1 Tax=Virgibacillus necropolis TaxID=163877 RepID=A0A221M969_9BACI|nr:asparaginase [Virgibacillus necropolis]ASN04177.1 asparaginase [Virgibacillus necropolis]